TSGQSASLKTQRHKHQQRVCCTRTEFGDRCSTHRIEHSFRGGQSGTCCADLDAKPFWRVSLSLRQMSHEDNCSCASGPVQSWGVCDTPGVCSSCISGRFEADGSSSFSVAIPTCRFSVKVVLSRLRSLISCRIIHRTSSRRFNGCFSRATPS